MADVDLRHTNYDRESAGRRIAATGFPNVPEFDMLNPPAAEKMRAVQQSGAEGLT
jgi:hypothetical protein